ncbi:MAG: hypothetical protein EHM63_04025 [Actinobacteria bacterium]|nr:MAG: hypothetical protein EHM63_04025 [Actinomycetota bacterium]
MYDRGNTFAGRIWVIDNNEVPGQDIVCCSKTRNPLGGDIANQCKVTAGSSDTPMQLDFDGPSATLTFTYRFFDCVLPPGTAIINYRGLAK